MDEFSGQIAEIQAKAQEEVVMLEGAEQAWIARGNPKPAPVEQVVKQSVTFQLILKRFGPASIMLLISLVGAMYISSVRVGLLMEISQILLIERFSVSMEAVGSVGNTEAMRWFGMMAFEGVLAAWGFWRGQHSVKQQWGKTAYYVSLAVTIIAGVLAGFTLTDNQLINNGLTILFAVLSGIGGPFAVAFTAENMGYVWERIINLDDEFIAEYNREKDLRYKDWETKDKAWREEFEKFIPYYMGQVFGEERRKKLAKFDGGSSSKEEQADNSQSDRIRKYLQERGIRPSEVGIGDAFRLAPSQIVDELALEGHDKKNIHTILTRLRKDEKNGKWNP